VGLEKLENYEGVAVKALLDSGAIDLFIDTKFAKKKGFKLERLKKSSANMKCKWNCKCGRGNYSSDRVQYVL